MTWYVLDTDMVSLFETGHLAVVQNVLTKPPSQLAVSIITVEEQLSGWYTQLRRSKKIDDRARVYQLMTNTLSTLIRFRLLTFTEPAMRRVDALKRGKINVGNHDLGIAATALELNATVVTRNLRDFGRIPGLAIEDWSQ